MKVSVALCTYNGGEFLRNQLQSIFLQSRPVNEIVICDDKSTDSTIDVINDFKTMYQGIIRLYINGQNLGVAKNFEKALELCTGEIIFLSDQDDKWMKDKVETCINFFDKNNDTLGCFTDAQIIANNNLTNKNLWASILFDGKIEDKNLFSFQVCYRNAVTGATLALKREALSLVLPIPVIGKMLHDEWIGLKLSEKELLGKINKPLIQYRIHTTQQTGLPAENYDENYFKIRTAIFTKDFKQYPLYHYFHWMRKLKQLPKLSEYLNIPKALYNEIKTNRDKSLTEYFITKSYFFKKKQLIKWFLEKKTDITIKDIFTR